TTRAQLQERFNLMKQVHNSIDNLDISINKAIAVRSQLQKAVTAGNVSKSDAKQAIDALNDDINSVVNFKIQSGEGGLVFRPQLRSWLGSFMRRVGMGLVAPTTSQKQVGSMYISQQQKASSQMAIDVGKAELLMKKG